MEEEVEEEERVGFWTIAKFRSLSHTLVNFVCECAFGLWVEFTFGLHLCFLLDCWFLLGSTFRS